mgnify:CR=1 FL=1
MSEKYTVWSNMEDGMIFWSCTKISPTGQQIEITTAQCWGYKISFSNNNIESVSIWS